MPMARLDELEQLLSALQRVATYQLFAGLKNPDCVLCQAGFTTSPTPHMS